MFIRTERSLNEFIRFYPIVSSLIIVHLLLWLIINFLQTPIGVQLYGWGVGSNFFIEQGEYWRLVTPIFLHADLMHVLFNSFALVLFGPALERMLGKVKFIASYLGAGIIGNIGTYFFGPSDIWYTHVGASGAIYGLFGMYLYMVIFRKDLIDPGSAQIVITLLIIGVVMTFARPNINTHAHLFGLVGGLFIAPLALASTTPFSRRQRTHDDDTIQFDPNRWKKKRIPAHVKKKVLWTIIGILVVLGLLNKVGFF
ncbi:MAG TPA: rhomboid family intramembrane serine protease [Bacillota bacterium]